MMGIHPRENGIFFAVILVNVILDDLLQVVVDLKTFQVFETATGTHNKTALIMSAFLCTHDSQLKTPALNEDEIACSQ